MFHKLRPHLTYANVVSSICLFLVVGGGSAYAVNEWTGANIVNESLTGVDVKGSPGTSTVPAVNGTLSTHDIAGQPANAANGTAFTQGTLTTWDIADGTLGSADVGGNSLAAADLAPNSVGVSEITDGAVRTGELANGQVQAEDLAPGVAPGASGARAWGYVSTDGTLLRSKNVSSVTKVTGAIGFYCIDPGPEIDPATAVMVVGEASPNDTNWDDDNLSHVEWDSGAPACPAGTMEVRTFIGFGNGNTGGELDAGGFNLDPDDEPFTFVIP